MITFWCDVKASIEESYSVKAPFSTFKVVYSRTGFNTANSQIQYLV